MMNPSQPPMAPVCCLCQTVFREPKVLPCLHTFCLDCLTVLASEDTKEINCPTCGCFITLPPDGVSGLKTNIFVKRLANLYLEEIRKNLHSGEQSERVEPDEGFADHSDVLLQRSGSIPRSETWHGDPSERTVSHIVSSQSVNGDTTLTSLSTKSADTESRPDPGVSQAVENTTETHEPTEEEDEARVEMKKEACVVTGKLTTKLMNLQGEALRITFAIDSVNQIVNHWRERNAEIKSQIQDRSLMLQQLIKRHEQKLLAEVDNLENYEQFLNETDRAKAELRGNLKRVLNAVQFLKQIQNFAQDEEILEMKDFLLGELKILASVETKQKEYTLHLPPVPSHDNLDEGFGSLTSVEKKVPVFEPDVGDMADGMKLTQLEKVKQMEYANLSSSKMRRRRAKTQQIRFSSPQGREIKFSHPRRATRVITSEDRDLERLSPVKSSPEDDNSEDMTDLQEVLRQRRRDFLEEKHVEEDLSNVHDVQLLSVHRRPTRERRRVQSFGGRASSRTRHMEEAAKEIQTKSDHIKKGHGSAKLDKTGSLDSADVVGNTTCLLHHEADGRPQAGDDISTKMKYLRENWKRRREILRSSESSKDGQGPEDLSPTSPASPKSPDDKGSEQSKFQVLHEQISSIQQHFASGESHPPPTQSPSRKTHGRHSLGSAIGEAESLHLSLQHQLGTDRPEGEEHVFANSSSASTEHLPQASSGGLTRTKLMEIRANARQKKERWRSQTLS